MSIFDDALGGALIGGMAGGPVGAIAGALMGGGADAMMGGLGLGGSQSAPPSPTPANSLARYIPTQLYPTRTFPEELDLDTVKSALSAKIADLHAAGLTDEAAEAEGVLAAL